MLFLHNLGPLEAIIIGVGCLATVAVPLGVVAVVVYMLRRSTARPPEGEGTPNGPRRQDG